MRRIISLPGKFIVGGGELYNLSEFIKLFGNSALLVTLKEDAKRVAAQLGKTVENGISLYDTDFGGECTYAEAARIGGICDEKGCDCIVGLGGGKAIDTAKCVSLAKKLPLLVAPTIASTDAPCSALIIMYDENHVMIGSQKMPINPAVVLCDSEVIAKAPVRFLVAGLGDAFATYYEARACIRTNSQNYVGGVSTKAAWALAGLCRETLLEDSVKAIEACKANVVSPALENIIEANLLLSGLGFECVGCGAAHNIHNALTILPETHSAMHGEKVAIGLLAQLIMENVPSDEFRLALKYYRSVGLPTKVSDIGISDENLDEKLMMVAKATVSKATGPIFNHEFEVNEDVVFSALKIVDNLNNIF